MRHISLIMLSGLLASGCTTGYQHAPRNSGIPVVEKSTRLPSPVVMRGGEVIQQQVKRHYVEVEQSQAQVFVPKVPAQNSSFTVVSAPYSPPVAAPEPKVVQKAVAAPKAPAPAVEPYDITESLNRELALEAQASAPAKQANPPKAAQASNRQNEINKLTLRYAEGDVQSAYDLAKILYQEKRSEEADTVLDYAARNNHAPSMLLYSERLKKLGDAEQSKHWLQAAADAGSKEAKQKLAN